MVTSSRIAVTNDMGLIPRVVFDVTSTMLRPSGRIKVAMSFMEIYNERIRDLLGVPDDTIVLRVREHPEQGVYVEGLTKIEVSSPEEALRLVLRGHAHRAVGQTERNQFSSRSHAIVSLEIIHPEDNHVPGERLKNIVRMQLTDLAGSEQDPTVSNDFLGIGQSKSHRAEDNILKNERKFIRTSLSTLSFIIQALDKPSARNLPYRDSLLTWLLREALTGSSRTTMVSTLSPCAAHYEESLLTLKYSQRLFSAGKKMKNVKSSFKTAQELELIASLSSVNAMGAGLRPSEVKKLATAHAEDERMRESQERREGSEDAWTEEFRLLRAQIIDLEIELSNARADKDTLALELEATRRALVEAYDAQRLKANTPPSSPNASQERERKRLQEIIIAKDERIEMLLAELTNERADRTATEATAVKQIHKLMDRIDELQMYDKSR